MQTNRLETRLTDMDALRPQQHCYCYTTLPGSVRRARIDARRISELTAQLCVQAMSQIPPGKRAWAVQTEMERLTAFEWKSK